MTHKGIPDGSRAARLILKDYVNGKLLYCYPPPGYDPEEFQQYSARFELDDDDDDDNENDNDETTSNATTSKVGLILFTERKVLLLFSHFVMFSFRRHHDFNHPMLIDSSFNQ